MGKKSGSQDSGELAVRSGSVLFHGAYRPSPNLFLAPCSHKARSNAEGLDQDVLTEGHTFQEGKKCGLQGRHYWFIFVKVGKIKARSYCVCWACVAPLQCSRVFEQPFAGRMVYDGASLPAGL